MRSLGELILFHSKEKYAREGVHKGMQGWICLDDNTFGTWLVNFPQCGEKEDIAEISVKEDLKIIPVMNAIVTRGSRLDLTKRKKTQQTA